MSALHINQAWPPGITCPLATEASVQDATLAHLELVCQAPSLLLFASVFFQLHNLDFIFAFCPLKFFKDHNVLSSSLDT